ncbi:MAG: tRNA lysidine(34) synthetase TilS, partial [Desulfobulbaceae bacterium]|nr:tRNA lysidine(34) synthetase TilS [Desulfobulbaceae bacterium]
SYPEGKRAGRQKKAGTVVSYQLLVPQAGRYEIPEIDREVLVELMSVVPSQREMRGGDADYLDVSAAPFPIVLRNRLPGDRFYPMSGRGGKKVADFLIDCKVPLVQRDKMPIVLSRDRIVAVLGGRIDQHAKVTAQTTAVLRISMRAR